MPIKDLFDNPIDPSASSFLGFRDLTEEAFAHDIYSFLIRSLRDCDQGEGNTLIFRWLEQAQIEFEAVYRRIESLPTLLDPATCPTEALPYLKWVVGFSGKLDFVTEELAEADLRRLISVAAKMWKLKGTESGLVETLEALTTRKARVVNYFAFRLLSDEWEIGREELGFDPWLLDVPGLSPSVKPDAAGSTATNLDFVIDGLLGSGDESGHEIRILCVPTGVVQVRTSLYSSGNNVVTSEDYMGQTGTPSTSVDDYRVGVDPDEFVSDVRIVDDGSLDRTLVENVVRLLRPSGERYNVRYLDFQDTFRETLRWEVVSGSAATDLDAGSLTLFDAGADSVVKTDETDDGSWTEYQAAAQFALSDASGWGELRFYYLDESNFYAVRLDPADGSVKLDEVVGGARATLATAYLTPPAIHPGLNYFVRVATTDTGAGHQIQFFVDENLLGTVVGADRVEGKLALAAETGQTMTVRFAELFQFPLESTRIGP